jgi:murein L,D-transpeptidase YafK
MIERRAFLLSLTAALLARSRSAHAGGPERRLHILKAKRTLEYEEDGVVVRSFRVGLGGAPEGDKQRQGDSKTPEGELYVGWKLEQSRFHRFLGLSYPMPIHAERGQKAKLIDAKTAEVIRQAVAHKRPPPQNTRLGGDVGIHGGGSSVDWTLGCIAVTDEEIEWLFARVRVGDPVLIEP